MSERSYSSQATEGAAEAAAQAEALAELASMPAPTLVAETAAQLANFAAMRLAGRREGQRLDLGGARLLIDAFAALLDGMAGRLGAPEQELRQALAQLRMAYVNATSNADAAPADGQQPGEQEPSGEQGAQGRPAAPADGDAAARIARPKSGLWVPGQPL